MVSRSTAPARPSSNKRGTEAKSRLESGAPGGPAMAAIAGRSLRGWAGAGASLLVYMEYPFTAGRLYCMPYWDAPPMGAAVPAWAGGAPWA